MRIFTSLQRTRLKRNDIQLESLIFAIGKTECGVYLLRSNEIRTHDLPRKLETGSEAKSLPSKFRHTAGKIWPRDESICDRARGLAQLRPKSLIGCRHDPVRHVVTTAHDCLLCF